MGFGDFEYKIAEIWEYEELHRDLTKIWPGGDPPYWTETQTIDTYTALTQGLDMIANDMLETRERYQTSIEPALRTILTILMDYDGKGAGLSKYSGSYPIRELITQLGRIITTPDEIWYIIEPVFSLVIRFTKDDRIRAVRGRLAEKLSAGLGDLAHLENLLETVVDVVWEFFKKAFIGDLVFRGNLDSLNKLILFFSAVIYSEFQAHYPEVTLAWCRSLDPNYNADLAAELSGVTRRVRINCPVNIRVFDAEGKMVASITDGIPDKEADLICYVNANGEKVVFLPGDGGYSMEIEATDGGHVSLTLEECDLTNGGVDRVQSYNEIEVVKGDMMTFCVPAIADKELKEHSDYGSSTYYELYLNGNWISESTWVSGADQIRETMYYTVAADSTGDGTVSGSGRFLEGTFAQLEAWPDPGAEFIGWYRDGALVSEEIVWRFLVDEDMELIARFTEMPTVEVHFEEAKGGSINMPDGAYPLGSYLQLEAVPKEGYRFVRWRVKEGGELADDHASKTDLKLTDRPAEEAVTVSAVFEKAESTTESSGRSIGSEELGSWTLWISVGTAVLAGLVAGALYISKQKEKRRE